MSTSKFELQQGGSSSSNLVTETRKPSKVRFLLGILLIIFLVLAIVFIVLYVNEKKDDDGDGGGVGRNSTQGQGGGSQGGHGQLCEDPSCVISAGGRSCAIMFTIAGFLVMGSVYDMENMYVASVYFKGKHIVIHFSNADP